jgi:hypothetical protein
LPRLYHAPPPTLSLPRDLPACLHSVCLASTHCVFHDHHTIHCPCEAIAVKKDILKEEDEVMADPAEEPGLQTAAVHKAHPQKRARRAS